MADLDDFFAKKDKKKSKGKKFATAEELAKKLEDTSKKSDLLKRKDRTNVTNIDGEESSTLEPVKEDEWKDFQEDDGQKDYSNLKIGQLTISEEEQNQVNMGNDIDGGSEGQSDGEGNSDNPDRPFGPWKKVTEGGAPGSQQPETPQPKQAPVSNVYVPPQLKNQPTPLGRVNLKARNRTAPDLANEEYFPSLSSATKQELLAKKKMDATFEEIKHGGRAQRTQDLPSNSPVTVGNRFNSLAD